jgi:YHS domain-containing protein
MNNTANTDDSVTKMATDTVSEKTYDVKILDNKKDPTCGMPVTAGVSDTAHYKNKVIGFCSGECKAEFLKNPTANIAAAELIK